MKSRTLIAWAVASSYAWSASAFAGGMHSAQINTGTRVEVQTPASVNESAPWRTGEAHLRAWSSPRAHAGTSSDISDVYSDSELGTGASASVSGSGSVGVDARAARETTEYWLIGSESAESNVGSSATEGAGGSVSFDSRKGGS